MSGPVKRPVVSRSERFVERLERQGLRLDRRAVKVLRVNVGTPREQPRRAAPRRPNQMDGPTASRILEVLAMTPGVCTLDIAGDGPELNRWFRLLVGGGRELGLEVVDRSDLTAFVEPGQEELPYFLRRHRVRIVGSLPGLTREAVDARRGQGVFDRIVRALRSLNEHGYGRGDPELPLDLVDEPSDARPPGEREALEAAWRERLRAEHGVDFDRLLPGGDLPIHRARRGLEREDGVGEPLGPRPSSFDPSAVEDATCRSLICVAWDGRLYDCALHRVLGRAAGDRPRSVWSIESFAELEGTPIAVGDHCSGCVGGSGGSAGGTSS